MFELIKNNPNNIFYGVDSALIVSAEKDMGVVIPEDLKRFYEELGYGFLETKVHNINRFMGPSSIEEFRLGIGQFENSEEVEIFEKYASDKLVFFEVNESLFLSIGISKKNCGKIFYYDDIIASSIEEFLERYVDDEKFFLNR